MKTKKIDTEKTLRYAVAFYFCNKEKVDFILLRIDEISNVTESMLTILGYMVNEIANIQREIGKMTEDEYYLITKLKGEQL